MQIAEVKDWAQLVSYFVGSVVGLVGLWFLVRRENKARSGEVDLMFSGNWTNEGIVGGIPETHYVDLELEVVKRDVSGVLSVRTIDSLSSWNDLGVSGRRRRLRASFEIIHVRGGQVQMVARVDARLKNGAIHWKLKKGVADFFPNRTELFKMDPGIKA